eukprot:Skav234402  [mRNA]  locus=scaffold873:292079:297737:- [translate_table: standard]
MLSAFAFLESGHGRPLGEQFGDIGPDHDRVPGPQPQRPDIRSRRCLGPWRRVPAEDRCECMTPISLEEGRQGTPLEVRRSIQVVPDPWTTLGRLGIVGELSLS